MSPYSNNIGTWEKMQKISDQTQLVVYGQSFGDGDHKNKQLLLRKAFFSRFFPNKRPAHVFVYNLN